MPDRDDRHINEWGPYPRPTRLEVLLLVAAAILIGWLIGTHS